MRDGCAEWVNVSHENILAQKAYGVNPYPWPRTRVQTSLHESANISARECQLTP
uniref:Uncharacterized protein n=1 Tax=Siphoviridae sp. ctRGj11 TaxID=2827868 RepID=A0A8S5SJQ2_9CAUD|nr:MAG TPA: hypothetical protein [Siphoviridae sp. ctRGj11]